MTAGSLDDALAKAQGCPILERRQRQRRGVRDARDVAVFGSRALAPARARPRASSTAGVGLSFRPRWGPGRAHLPPWRAPRPIEGGATPPSTADVPSNCHRRPTRDECAIDPAVRAPTGRASGARPRGPPLGLGPQLHELDDRRGADGHVLRGDPLAERVELLAARVDVRRRQAHLGEPRPVGAAADRVQRRLRRPPAAPPRARPRRRAAPRSASRACCGTAPSARTSRSRAARPRSPPRRAAGRAPRARAASPTRSRGGSA